MTRLDHPTPPAAERFQDLRPLFWPGSVAVVGASDDPNRIGGMPLRHLREHQYGGNVFPVNPSHQVVQGLPAFPSLSAIHAPVDVVVVALAADRVLPTLTEAIAIGARGAVVFSAGFAETGRDGAALQKQLAHIAAQAGLAVVGPNCVGIANFASGAILYFGQRVSIPVVRGRAALVAQSGSFGGNIFAEAQARGIGFSYLVSSGNEAVTDVADYLSFFADDAETDVILLYLEGINDGPRFLYAARRAYAAGKTVVALKVGGTREGAGAVATHTAVLSGSAEATSAAFRAAGVIEAEDPAQLVDAALLAMHRRADAPIPGKRVGIVTISGGAGVLLTDQLIRRAFDVARSSPPTREALASFLPSFAGLNNPVDVTANVMHQPETFGRAVTVVAEDPSIDQVLVVPGTLQTDEFSAVLAAAQHSTGKPLIAVNMAGSQRVGLSLRSHGIPVFDDYSRCTNAMQLLANARPPEDIVVSGDSASLPAISAGTAGVLSEAASKAIVAATGVAIPCGTVVIGEDEAVAAAERLGYPVVLKLHGADVFHKSDVKGVHLQLADPAAVRAAFRALRAMGSGPEVLVEQQLSRPVAECLLAIRADSVFGSVLVFGAGGVLAELIQDVTAALCPVSRATAEAMLGRTRMGRLLGGIRGRPAGDVEALLEAMQNFSTLGPLMAGRAEVIEINPLLVFELGRGVAAVDARVSQGVQGSG